MTRKQIIEELDEISETIEELENARKVFLEYAENVEFELEDLKTGRHYLVEELLSKHGYLNVSEEVFNEE